MKFQVLVIYCNNLTTKLKLKIKVIIFKTFGHIQKLDVNSKTRMFLLLITILILILHGKKYFAGTAKCCCCDETFKKTDNANIAP